MNVVPGTVFGNLITGLTSIKADIHPSGRMQPVMLQCLLGQAPALHRLLNLLTKLVIANTADKHRLVSHGLQMPGNIERCTAELIVTVRETVKQDFTKYRDGFCVTHDSVSLSLVCAK